MPRACTNAYDNDTDLRMAVSIALRSFSRHWKQRLLTPSDAPGTTSVTKITTRGGAD